MAKQTVKQTPTGQRSFCCLTAEALPVREVVDSVSATYEQRKRGVTEFLDQEVEVSALFMGPFALDHLVQEKADYWRARLEEEYSLRLNLKVALPPFQTEDLDCKGFWLNPQGKTYEKRVKNLRS